MTRTERNAWTTVVAGFGSPHGDDQAGWRVVAMLAGRPNLPARVIAAHEPTQVLTELAGTKRLIVIDACQTGAVAGAVTRLVWPDPRINTAHGHSTHGVGVVDMLLLADKLECLPSTVEIIGIEVEDCSPGRYLTPAVVRSVAEVEAQLVTELCEVAHA